MAGGMDPGDKGGKGKKKKPLDTAINLVPFIDLMAVTISFLIMTAVWTQIGRLQAGHAGGPTDPNQEQTDRPVPLSLLISEKELRLSAGSSAYAPIPITRDSNNKVDLTGLIARLDEVKAGLPDQSQITLNTEDSVRYEDLVRIIDECVGSGLPNVVVSPASSP